MKYEEIKMTIGTKNSCEIARIVILDNVTLRKQFTILIHALPSGTHLSRDIRRMLALEEVNLEEYYCIRHIRCVKNKIFPFVNVSENFQYFPFLM